MTRAMSKEVLIIGSYYAEGLKSSSWSSELPNLSDYDIIILDTTKILHGWLIGGRVKHLGGNRYYLSKIYEADEKIKSNIKLVRSKLLEILEFDILVYILYSPEASIECNRQIFDQIGETYQGFIETNDWCPISIEIKQEKGERIFVKDDSYIDYFRDFKGWEYYFVPDSLSIEELEEYYRGKWKTFPGLRAIATNKVDKPLAIIFSPIFCALRDDKIGWYPDNKRVGGKLVFLPVIDQYHTESLVESLLRISKVIEITPPPKWVSAIEIPGESSLKHNLAEEQAELEELEATIGRLQESLNELQKIKGILYETGLTLQELVKSALDKLGVKIRPSVVTDEFIIEIDGSEALIEVKGNVRSITKDDVAQLVADLMEHLKTTGQEINGILIGNGWRLEPPEQRDIGNKTLFSRDATRVAENHNIGLLSTTELFRAYCQTLEDPTHKEKILDKIIGGVGILRL